MTQRAEMICTKVGKVMYPSQKSATQASVRFKQRKRNSAHTKRAKSTEKTLQAYPCDHCEMWHLGHRSEETKKRKGGKARWLR
jgi:hypothetical protein